MGGVNIAGFCTAVKKTCTPFDGHRARHYGAGGVFAVGGPQYRDAREKVQCTVGREIYKRFGASEKPGGIEESRLVFNYQLNTLTSSQLI